MALARRKSLAFLDLNDFSRSKKNKEIPMIIPISMRIEFGMSRPGERTRGEPYGLFPIKCEMTEIQREEPKIRIERI